MNAPRALTSLAVLAASALFTSPAAVLADGKVFSRAQAVVNIPDQEAIIHFADGVQTLVIETRFNPPSGAAVPATDADAAAFAWVVPVPRGTGGAGRAAGGGVGGDRGGGVPEVFAVTTGVFPTLRAVCAPQVVHNVAPLHLPLIALAVLLLVCAAIPHRVGAIVAAVIIGLIVLGLLLPSLGKARSAASDPSSGVEVLERTIVGSFDIAVVGSSEPDPGGALRDWLEREGFHVPAAARPVISDYARDGWVFVAAKLRPEEAGADGAPTTLTPHPLAIRFSTPTPVYPMRLTAVENRSLTLDLYVFGTQRAVVEGMEPVRCGAVSRLPAVADDRSPAWPRTEASIPIAHRQILPLIAEATILTKLSGTFTPDRMHSDLAIAWAPFAEIGARKYSARGASMFAVNLIAALWLAAIIGVLVAGALVRVRSVRLARWGLAALAPCLLVGLAVRAFLPTTDVTVSHARFLADRRVPLLVETAAAGCGEHPFDSLDAARAAFGREFDRLVADQPRSASALRRPHEDSPGNYIVRERDGGGYEAVWFDEIGRERATPLGQRD